MKMLAVMICTTIIEGQRAPEPPAFCSTSPLTNTSSTPGLIGWWRFDGPRDGQDSILAHDWSIGNTVLQFTRFSFQHPFSRLVHDVGLAGSGAAQLFGRSDLSTSELIRPARAISLWVNRFDGYFRNDNIVTASGIAVSTSRVSPATLIARVPGIQCTMPLPLIDGNYVHIAVSLNDSGLLCSVNGSMNFVARQVNYSTLQGTSVRVGGTTHGQLVGYVDELRIYDSQISEAEVQDLASSAQTLGSVSGQNLPPVVYEGLPQTLWKPQTNVPLHGSCFDPDGPQSNLSVLWTIRSTPANALQHISLTNMSCTTANLVFTPNSPPGDYSINVMCSDGFDSRTATATIVLFDEVDTTPGETIFTAAPDPTDFPQANASITPVLLFEFNQTDANCSPDPFCGTLSNSVNGSDATILRTYWGNHTNLTAGPHNTSAIRLEYSHVDFGNPEESSPEIWPEITFSYWFRSEKSNRAYMFRKGRLSLDVGTTGQLALNGGRIGSPILVNEWYHVVVSQGPNISKFWVNGFPLWNGPGVVRNEADKNDHITFGLRPGDNHPAYSFQGDLDDLVVYNFFLSNEEAMYLYNNLATSFTDRESDNPYWNGGYSSGFIRQNFPPLPEITESFTGDSSAIPHVPPPNSHPRIYFRREDLPALRHKFRYSASGIAAMGNLRGLITEELDTAHPREWGFNITHGDMGNSHHFINEAFRVLIDADSVGARRIVDLLVSVVPDIHNTLNASTCTDWQHCAHDSLFRVGFALMYDFVHPWMTEAERAVVRTALASATQRTWSIGMDALLAQPASTSNWVPWLTFDLALNMMAFENETGWDGGVAARSMKTVHQWLEIGVNPTSGATYEGMGKNALGLPKIIATSMRGGNYHAHPSVRNHVTRFLLHSMLPNGDFVEEGLWGGSDKKPEAGDMAAAITLFPDDPKVNFVYRNAVQQHPNDDNYYPLTPARMTLYSYNVALTRVIFAHDWQGPSSWEEHARIATAREPLTYVAVDRGLVTTRSSWDDQNGAYLWMQARSSPGGHSGGFRGSFVYMSHGELWVPYPGGNAQTVTSAQSLILVNGQGQNGAPGHLVNIFDSPQGTFAAADLKLNYGAGGWANRKPNDFLLRPDSRPWFNLNYSQLPDWRNGVYPQGGQDTIRTAIRATRTVGLVRSGDSPFSLIIDDIQNDTSVSTYTWRMLVHRGWPISEYRNVTVNGNDMILTALEGRTAVLLVRILPGSSSFTDFTLGNTSRFVEITSQVVSARFRVLLCALPNITSPRPITSWDPISGRLSVITDGINTTITLGIASNGSTVVENMTQGDVIVNFVNDVWTAAPTGVPSSSPSALPTMTPSVSNPSDAPTLSPTKNPSVSPSQLPTVNPSLLPTFAPTPETVQRSTPAVTLTSASGDSSDTSIIVVAAVAAMLVVIAIIVAVVVIRHNQKNIKAKEYAESRSALENPAYDAPAIGENDLNVTSSFLSSKDDQLATTGYADLPPNDGKTGYSDLPPNDATTGYADLPPSDMEDDFTYGYKDVAPFDDEDF